MKRNVEAVINFAQLDIMCYNSPRVNGGIVMKKVVMLYPVKNNIPMHVRRLRVAAYCRVSTEHEEQDGSIELQEDYFRAVIDGNRNWTNAGIFSERTTGLKLKNRKQFNAMIRKCKSGKIDLILTKSISRFGRNTLDELKALQDLRILGVDVYFEQENLWLHDQQVQTLITLYCALAQNESENISRNIRWGIRQGFKSGTSGFADFICYGYRQDENGNLIVHDTEAKIVQEIFEMRAAGFSLGKISEWLFENGILSPTGKERWSRETLSKMLKNEKYVGDVMLQKTFVDNLFDGKQIVNNGELDRVLIQNHHHGIVDRQLFAQVNGSDE